MLVAMYFLIIRPNSKRRKEAAKLQSIARGRRRGDHDVGIIGTITGEDGPTRFWLEIDDDVQVRIARGGIQGRSRPTTQNDAGRRATTDADDGRCADDDDDA